MYAEELLRLKTGAAPRSHRYPPVVGYTTHYRTLRCGAGESNASSPMHHSNPPPALGGRGLGGQGIPWLKP